MISIMAKPAHAPFEPIAPRAVVTAPKQRVIGRPFEKGQSGNPAGRPKSARSRHSENFLASFANDFEEHGAQVIAQVRRETPAIYLKIAADLLPKESVLDVNVDIAHRAQSQLEAFRLLRDASRSEIDVLRSHVNDEEAVG
jgi:hypothetical protein